MSRPGEPPEGWPDEPFHEGTGAWSEADDHDDDTPPYWFPGQHLPADARRLGLDHTVPDGALLDFAGALDPAKPLHRVTAWVMLAVFATPAALHVVRLLGELAS